MSPGGVMVGGIVLVSHSLVSALFVSYVTLVMHLWCSICRHMNIETLFIYLFFSYRSVPKSNGPRKSWLMCINGAEDHQLVDEYYYLAVWLSFILTHPQRPWHRCFDMVSEISSTERGSDLCSQRGFPDSHVDGKIMKVSI